MADERPSGITILAILGFIVGISETFIGIIATFALPSLYGVAEGEIVGAVAAGISAGLILHGIIVIACAWGLWTGKSWAWWLGMIFFGLSVLRALLLNIVGAAIGAIVIWYLLKPHVKEYFGVNVKFST